LDEYESETCSIEDIIEADLNLCDSIRCAVDVNSIEQLRKVLDTVIKSNLIIIKIKPKLLDSLRNVTFNLGVRYTDGKFLGIVGEL